MVRKSKLALVLTAVALLVTCSVAMAASKAARGTLKSVAASGTEMVVTDDAKKDWMYRVYDGAMIICPAAKEAKASDLKPGADVSVLWQKKGDQLLAIAVLHHEGDYKNCGLVEGKFKSGDNKQFVITDDKGKDYTYEIDANTRIRQNNQAATASSFKAGDRIIFVYNKQGDRFILLDACNPPE